MPVTLSSYHARLASIRSTSVSRLGAAWMALGTYRDPDIDRFIGLSVPRVQAAQIASATSTAAYLGGRVDRAKVLSARKVDPFVEFHRPGVAVWTALSNGQSIEEAVQAGLILVETLIETDLQLAVTAQSQSSLEQTGHRFYKRVLTGSENCDLCRLASTHTYSRDDLLPIHDHCDCTVEPIRDETAIDVTIDVSSLRLTSARSKQVADGAAPESLVATRYHGELGPVLTWASDSFTGPSDLAA